MIIMSKRKNVIQNEPWESNKKANQKFTKICDDMQDSMAWHKLGLESQGLYLFLKKKYTKKSDGSTNENDIHITNKDIRTIGKNRNTLMKYLDKLIENGFIRVVKHGKLSRTPNIYGFCGEWKKYNQKNFFVHPNHKRLTKTNSYDYTTLDCDSKMDVSNCENN